MARGRMIDKRISMSKKLGRVHDKARVLYFMIYPHLDKEGRIKFEDIEDLRDEIIPKFKDWPFKKVAEALDELADVKLVILYPNGKDIAMQFTRFGDFQPGLRKDREAESIVPEPPESAGVYRITPALSLMKFNEAKGRKEEKTSCSEKPSERAFKYSEIHKNLAKLLETKIKERMPRHRFTGKEYLEQWANEFRIMEEKEEVAPAEIEKLIVWVSKHDFWYRNIRSADKLRKQFGVLWAEMEDEAKKRGKRFETPEEFTRRQKKALEGK